MKQSLESVIVHDATATTDFLGDPVSALLDPAGCFRIHRGTVDYPLHYGIQVCQSLRVDACVLGLGDAHANTVIEVENLSREADKALD